jgi:hypothetical protein
MKKTESTEGKDKIEVGLKLVLSVFWVQVSQFKSTPTLRCSF